MKFSVPENQSPSFEAYLPQRSSTHLVVMGINHHSCPLHIREKFVIPESCIGHALKALAALPHVREAAILSTCNRTEVFAVTSDVQAALQEIESFFISVQRVSDHGALRPNFRLLYDDVALHLFRVASGLDSLVLGEGQIMSQVKLAHRKGQEAGTIGPVLDQIFQLALSCGKRVRTETSMGRRAVSVSGAAVELAREIVGDLGNKAALVIGAGRMAQICVKHILASAGNGPVMMVNRTVERLEHFAGNRLPNKDRLQLGFSFDDRYQLAAASDVVIVATSAPSFVISTSDLQKQLNGRKVTVIDISVPRNVEPGVGELSGVALYHADDLSQIVNRNLAEREALTIDAEELVFESLAAYHAWQRSLLVAPTITDLRRKIESIRTQHLTQNDCDNHDDFEELSRALVNQILHHPTIQLKSTSDYQKLRQHAEALRKLFDLDAFGNTRPAMCPEEQHSKK